MPQPHSRLFLAVLPADLHNVCMYCGEPGNYRDHWMPWSVHHKPWWVPACNQCNGALGDRQHFTLSERSKFLQRWLFTKYRRVLARDAGLRLPGTTGRLRQAIQEEAALRAWADQRLRWAESLTAFGSNLTLSELSESPEGRDTLAEIVRALHGSRRARERVSTAMHARNTAAEAG